MKIQIITNRKINLESSIYTLSSLGAPRSLDSFDINIVDLSCEDIWISEDKMPGSINCKNDLASIQEIMRSVKRASIIIVYPQNVKLKYFAITDFQNKKRYTQQSILKDILPYIESKVFSYVLPKQVALPLEYENSETECNKYMFDSAFVFKTDHFQTEYMSVITKAKGSEKATTICLGERLYYTTLNLFDALDHLEVYLDAIGAWPQKHSDYPEWLNTLGFYDDVEKQEIIDENKRVISDAMEEINKAEQVLDKNRRYKSILITNGDNLVEVVFEILALLFEYDLSEFVDLKKEDFLIHLKLGTLIGEIKGITSNVKSEHISQLDVHYQGYLDKLQEQDRTENVKQVLVINPFRNKPLDQREPVHEIQINLAKRNGALIIETVTLLKILEMYLKGEVTKDEIANAVFANSGLMSAEMITCG